MTCEVCGRTAAGSMHEVRARAMSTRDDIERALAGAPYAHDPDLRMRHTGEHRCNGPWGIEDVVYHDDCDAARVLATLTVRTRWLRWQQERIEACGREAAEEHPCRFEVACLCWTGRPCDGSERGFVAEQMEAEEREDGRAS